MQRRTFLESQDIWQYAWTAGGLLGDALTVIMLSGHPKKAILSKAAVALAGIYPGPQVNPVFLRSGRSALAALFSGITKVHKVAVIAVPEYVCNVVTESALATGLSVKRYRLGNSLQPDPGHLAGVIRGQKAIVVLVPLFGQVFDIDSTSEWIREVNPGVQIVLDACQVPLPSPTPRFDCGIHHVLSFNQKAIPGLLGGAVLTPNPEVRRAVVREAMYGDRTRESAFVALFFKRLLVMMRNASLRNRQRVGFPYQGPEVSLMRRAHYKVQPALASRISLASMVVAVSRLSVVNGVRAANTSSILGPMRTPVGEGVVVSGTVSPPPLQLVPGHLEESGFFPSGLPWKGPYVDPKWPMTRKFNGLRVLVNSGDWVFNRRS